MRVGHITGDISYQHSVDFLFHLGGLAKPLLSPIAVLYVVLSFTDPAFQPDLKGLESSACQWVTLPQHRAQQGLLICSYIFARQI